MKLGVTANVYSGDDLAYCGSEDITVIKAAEETVGLTDSPSRSKCDSSATYEVVLDSIAMNPYPIKKSADLTVDILAKAISQNEDVAYCSIEALGQQIIKLEVDKTLTPTADTKIETTQHVPYIPFVEHLTAQAICYDKSNNSLVCYNVKIAFA